MRGLLTTYHDKSMHHVNNNSVTDLQSRSMITAYSKFLLTFIHRWGHWEIAGPWTRSMEGVHGPGPDKGSIDRGSMFCTFPLRNIVWDVSISLCSLRKKRSFWVKSGRTDTWWRNMINGISPADDWKRNFRMSRERFSCPENGCNFFFSVLLFLSAIMNNICKQT
jgi:hypothetical protein